MKKRKKRRSHRFQFIYSIFYTISMFVIRIPVIISVVTFSFLLVFHSILSLEIVNNGVIMYFIKYKDYIRIGLVWNISFIINIYSYLHSTAYKINIFFLVEMNEEWMTRQYNHNVEEE